MKKILKLDHRIIPVAIIDISINSIINGILDVSCFKGQKEKVLLSQNWYKGREEGNVTHQEKTLQGSKEVEKE